MHSVSMFFRFSVLWIQIGAVFGYGSHMFVIWVVIDRFERIGNWTAFEVLLLLGMNRLAYAIAALFTSSSFWRLGHFVRSGGFDEFLIRPMSTPLYFIIKEFHYGYLAHILISSFVIALSFHNLSVSFTLLNFLWLLIVILSGGLIQLSLMLYTTIASFWLVRADSIMSFFVWGFRDFSEYPISIFPRFIQIFLTFVIPFAFINFYPAQYFIGKSEFLTFHPYIQFMGPFVGLSMFSIAILLWKAGLKRYQSTDT